VDENIKKLLDKINMDENSYPYFNDAKMTKIKVNQKQNTWLIYIDKDNLLPLEILEELEKKKMNLDDKANRIEFVFEIKNPDTKRNPPNTGGFQHYIVLKNLGYYQLSNWLL